MSTRKHKEPELASYKTAKARGLRHVGVLPVINIDGALHRVALMRDVNSGAIKFIDTLGWHEIEVDLDAKVFFTRRRAENAAMQRGLTAWVGRSAERLGMVVGQTFVDYAKEEGRFDTIGFDRNGTKRGPDLNAIVVQVITQQALRAAAA